MFSDNLLEYIQSSSSLRFCASCEAKDFKQYSQYKGFLLLRHHYVSFSKPESLCSIFVSACSVQQTTDIPALIKHAQRISENKEKHILKVCCPIRNRAKTFEQHINLLTVSYPTSWQELSQLRIPLKTTQHVQSSEVSAHVRLYFSRFLVLHVQWRRMISQQRSHSAASTCWNMLPLQWSINTETLDAADLSPKSLIHLVLYSFLWVSGLRGRNINPNQITFKKSSIIFRAISNWWAIPQARYISLWPHWTLNYK